MTTTTSTTTKKLVLYTFPPVPNVYSVSPFGLKAESFLRINKIPYETCYTSFFGKNGTIPYLRIFDNGDDPGNDSKDYEEISDSNEILAYFRKNPDYDTTVCEEDLTKEQKAIAHACLRMIEEHTGQTGFYFRYGLHVNEFLEATEFRERVFQGDESKLGNFVFKMFKKGMPKTWGKKAKFRGFTRYGSPEVVWSMAGEDLQALEDLLGAHPDSNYFFGRPTPGILDCTVFGHLAQFLYIDIDFPQKAYLKENCPGLLRFMEHFKHAYFPDWETLCERKPNEGMSMDSPKMQSFHKKLKVLALGATTLVVAVAAVAYQTLQGST